MRLANVDKRLWAVGLQWITDKKATLERAMREAEAQGNGAERFSTVAFRSRQYGLGTDVSGKTLCPLAAALRLPSSFLGVFSLEDADGTVFWWVLAVRHGIITAQGDNLFATREEAHAHVLSGVEDLLGEFENRKICESPEESLAWLAPLLPSRFSFTAFKIRLQPLRAGKHAKKHLVLAIAGLALVSVYGASLLLEHKATQKALEASRLALMDKERHRRELAEHPERHFPMPWNTSLSTADMFKRCVPAMLDVPVSASGWLLAVASCNGHSLTVTWLHQPGADYLSPPPAAKVETPEKAVAVFTLGSFDKKYELLPHIGLPVRETVNRHLYQLTQNLGIKLNMNFGKPQKTVKDKVELVAPWLRGDFELSAVPSGAMLDFPALSAALSVPGLVLEQIRMENFNWNIKGAVYAKSE